MFKAMNVSKGSRQLSGFWLAPLLAGSCLATGYEVTLRLMIPSESLEQIGNESLKNLRPSFKENHEEQRHDYSDHGSIITSYQNRKKESLKKEGSKTNRTLNKLQGYEMQVLLNTLEKNLIKPDKKPSKAHRKQNYKQPHDATLSNSRTYSANDKKNFNDLFKTLSKP